MYAQRLVAVIEAHCAGATVEDKTMRTLGAVVFKNLVKAKWAPEVKTRKGVEPSQGAAVRPEGRAGVSRGSAVLLAVIGLGDDGGITTLQVQRYVQ